MSDEQDPTVAAESTNNQSPSPGGKSDWGKLALNFAKGAGKVALVIGKALFDGAGAAADAVEVAVNEQADMSSREGVRRANVAATVLMEEVFVHFNQRVWVSPQFSWRQIKANEPYMQLVFMASWQHEANTVGQAKFTPTTQMQLDLKFEQQVDGSTIIRYQYTQASNNLMNTDGRANDLVKLTNKDIQAICSNHLMPRTNAGG